MSYYIIIRGPLGCGKSTISKRLTERLGARYFPIDDILDQHDLGSDKEEGYVSQRSFKKANELAAPDARRFLEAGTPVIFDGNFYWESQVDDLKSRLDYPRYVFTLNVPLEVCIERDSKRNPPHGPDAARVVYNKTMSFSKGIEIDASGDIESTIEDILKWVSYNDTTPVEIVDYDPKYKEYFDYYENLVLETLPSASIEMVGSAAVPMKGKKEIDMMVICDDVNKAHKKLSKLFNAGPIFEGKGYLNDLHFGVEAEFHVVKDGDPHIERVRYFIRILKENPELKRELEDIKMAAHGLPRDEYKRAKRGFLKKVLG